MTERPVLAFLSRLDFCLVIRYDFNIIWHQPISMYPYCTVLVCDITFLINTHAYKPQLIIHKKNELHADTATTY